MKGSRCREGAADTGVGHGSALRLTGGIEHSQVRVVKVMVMVMG